MGGMSDIGGWRDKADLDLTHDDLEAMMSAGAPVEVIGPMFTTLTVAEPTMKLWTTSVEQTRQVDSFVHASVGSPGSAPIPVS